MPRHLPDLLHVAGRRLGAVLDAERVLLLGRAAAGRGSMEPVGRARSFGARRRASSQRPASSSLGRREQRGACGRRHCQRCRRVQHRRERPRGRAAPRRRPGRRCTCRYRQAAGGAWSCTRARTSPGVMRRARATYHRGLCRGSPRVRACPVSETLRSRQRRAGGRHERRQGIGIAPPRRHRVDERCRSSARWPLSTRQ